MKYIISFLTILSLSSFTNKILVLSIAPITCVAQGYNNSSNSDGSYTIYKRNSPTNTYGNRIDILKITTDSFQIRHNNLYFPSTTSITAGVPDGKIAWFDSDGKMQASPVSSLVKRQELFSGSTNASGVYTGTFTAFSSAPNIQANIVNQSATNQFLRITAISTTGFTINVFQRNSVNLLGVDVLLSTTANTSGANIDVLITEK